MALGVGHKTVVALGNESTWGTPVARTKFLEHVGVTGGLKDPYVGVESFRGATLRRHFRGLKMVDAQLKHELNYEGQELLWYHLFGAVATTTPGGGTNSRQHTFTLVDTTPAGLSVEVDYGLGGSTARVWEGCKVARCELAYQLDKLVQAAFNIIGEDESLSAATAPTFPAELPVIFSHVALQKDGVTFDCRELSVVIDTGLLTDRRKLGSRNIKEPVRGKRPITGRLVVDLEDNTYHALLTGDTAFKINAIATGGVVEGSINYKHNLELPVCYVREDNSDITDAGILRITLDFECEFDDAGAADAAKLVLTNGVLTVP